LKGKHKDLREGKMSDERNMLRQYRELMQEVDDAVRTLEDLHRKHLRCRPGCCRCCTLSSVLPLEAAALRLAIAGLPGELQNMIRSRTQEESCPLLVDARCVVYRSRPLICRTHGLPIAYVDYERQSIDVSVCPLNFSEEYEFDRQQLLFLDPVNGRLAQLNTWYCTGQGIAPAARIGMVDIVSAAWSGSAKK
jgi:Fe-S-cluster containining protein